MITANKELFAAILTVFRQMDEASSPTDPAVRQAKRAILNGLAEAHLIDALDDAPILAALIALPRPNQPVDARKDHR